MFKQQGKKKAPPRPPPPNLLKLKSKSTLNLTQNGVPNLMDWSPPSSPKTETSRQFGGSVSSSYSSSTSSLTSSKKSLENDNSLLSLNWTSGNNNNTQNQQIQRERSPVIKPRIIRPLPPKKPPPRTDAAPLPMPKVPPPSPPKGNFQVLTPYGIALYDFPATQPGDLQFTCGDVVLITRRMNSEWLFGKLFDSEREGIFPESFIDIKEPLPSDDTRIVTVLYEFKPEMAGDLAIKPGQQVKILHEVSEYWLYGECDGRRGQFPKTYVSDQQF